MMWWKQHIMLFYYRDHKRKKIWYQCYSAKAVYYSQNEWLKLVSWTEKNNEIYFHYGIYKIFKVGTYL